MQAITTPGQMAQGGGSLAIYVDSRASSEQRAALEAIFSGGAGGPPSFMMPIISKHLAPKAVEINFTMNGITEVTVKGIPGRGGRDVVWFENVGHPYSARLAAAKGTDSNYKDHSLDFHNSGRNAHFSGIDWTSS